MDKDTQKRLMAETRTTAENLNKLNTFLAGDKFPTLAREDKDLLYKQSRLMNKLVQVLGKRLERSGAKFTHKD